jgi:hypothetical protein
MPNVSPVKYPSVFAVRVDQDCLDAVDELGLLQTPILSKSKVISEAVMILKRAKARGMKRSDHVPEAAERGLCPRRRPLGDLRRH